MEIRTLRYFLETAREGNMTRAAHRLFVSQSTMSKQLKVLEDELGVKLFIRSNYSIRLTEAGMLLRERAEDILSLADRTMEEFKSLEEINSGDIYIGAPESASMRQFTDMLRDLQREFPKIRYNIYSGNLEDVCERLDKGLLDFALVLDHADISKYGCIELPFRDTWGLIMRRDDPLAEKEALTIRDMKALPLICSRQWLDHEFPLWFGSGAGDIEIAATYNLAFNGAVMTASGIGCAVVLNGLVETGESSGLAFRPITDAPPAAMYVIWRKAQTFSHAAELVMREIESRFLTDNL